MFEAWKSVREGRDGATRTAVSVTGKEVLVAVAARLGASDKGPAGHEEGMVTLIKQLVSRGYTRASYVTRPDTAARGSSPGSRVACVPASAL